MTSKELLFVFVLLIMLVLVAYLLAVVIDQNFIIDTLRSSVDTLTSKKHGP